jgi:hypothetical protein
MAVIALADGVVGLSAQPFAGRSMIMIKLVGTCWCAAIAAQAFHIKQYHS